MNKKTKGIIAGTAGIALLAGGATFATWSDSATQNGGVITSGNLDIEPVGAPTWYDVSADRTDGGAVTPVTNLPAHTVDLTQWKIVPGDRAEATYSFDVKLEGDNLAAKLDLSNFPSLAANGATASYKVYDKDAAEITSKVVGGKLTFVGGDAGPSLKNASNVVVDGATGPGGAAIADVHVVVTVDFAADRRENVQADVFTLGQVGVSLTQVRGSAEVAGF
ncbi:alternate-type signal peptide domain-containing protein [Cellulomonas sp. KH9]|uniref:alternate-type signal peptide domain-containing protein n=1 Tax=Cellulomonas sp. KH9 TaxID=1855324 RepID=UPI0008EEA195|nr:alternate-type signal peptide domain-containing protein [Cellulomonas sp. KH9]SFJ80444.1 alternate signal-mediated exported protein, RER_14450 family [Cellulomonas sp. KH9]